MRISSLTFLSFVAAGACFTFQDPGESGVEFGEFTGVARVITVDENNAGGRKKFVILTGVEDELTISPNAQAPRLGITSTVDDPPGQVYLEVNLMNYEELIANDIETTFVIDIYETSDLSTRQTISLRVRNLDDEPPTLSTTSCSILEEHPFDVADSTCEFQVTDADGFLAQMNYSNIVEDDGRSLFEFQYRNQPQETDYSASVFLVLKTGQTLDYETKTLYTFHLEAVDSGGNPTNPLPSIPIIVQVLDYPDEPPKWEVFQSAYTINEEEEFKTRVSAQDGDYGINCPIIYDIVDESGHVTIDKLTGDITVSKIDRDENNINQITFLVKAIEDGEDPSNKETHDNMTLFITDIDDNIAEIAVLVDGTTLREFTADIEENIADLTVLGMEITASDIDFGENAIYGTSLSTDVGFEYFLDAFSVIPSRGYETTTLTLNIKDPSKLDYETPKWRTIKMTLITAGTHDSSMIDSINITLTLIDLNDEPPIFDPEEYNITIAEDVDVGTSVVFIQATDADQEDIDLGITHEILGTFAQSILHIEPSGGLITTSKLNAFDYEKQNELNVQIKASDNNGHSATAQLTIHITDVDDEDPRLFVSSTIDIEENQDPGTVLTTDITATDDDTEPNLVFSIDWTQSYAMKNSRRVTDLDIIQCIDVDTVPGTVPQQATAQLSICTDFDGDYPDYEKFDSLYIYLIVNDTNTKLNDGTDHALIVISIQDINDNYPVFDDGTETARRRVTENSPSGTEITSVSAKDADIADNVTYSIEPADDSPLWVAIDSTSGTITVFLETSNDKIDCDDPKRDSLKYTVSANDSVHITEATITIDIVDVNDNVPEMPDVTWVIPERPNSDESAVDDSPEYQDLTLDGWTDLDRDAPNNLVVCNFASSDPAIRQRFVIDNNVMRVQLQPGVNLDREETPSFSFELDCRDDPDSDGTVPPNHVNPNPKVSITLTDINDNAPTIRTTQLSGLVDETSEGDITTLDGYDADIGDNGIVDFVEISQIKRRLKIDGDDVGDPPQDLIVVANGDGDNKGILTINGNLTSYYGYLILTINLTDKGTPPLSQNVDVYLEVLRYNFKEPLFMFPNDGDTIYLQEVQDANSGLKLFNGDAVDNIQATDQQDHKFDINFKIAAQDSDDGNLFKIQYLGNSQAQLQMSTSSFPLRKYQVTITAIVDAEPNVKGESFQTNSTFIVNFFNKDETDPVFSVGGRTIEFEENIADLNFTVDRANYELPDLPPNLPVRYLIKEGDRSLFDIDTTLGVVLFLQPLDFETQPSYSLTLQSSNSEKLRQDPVPETQYQLTINVIDVNDNPPVFKQKEYVTTVTIQAITTNSILQVEATDVDTTSAELTFNIDSWTASDDSIKDLPAPFRMDSSGHNGTITPVFTPKDTFKGYFTLSISVKDEGEGDDHTDTAEVKIYLVTTDNIVRFTFENDQETVMAATDAIKTILDDNFSSYNYITNVESPTQGSSENGSPRTISQVYFLGSDTNAPIQATEIYKKVTDVKFFNQLKQAFVEVGLLLLSFDSETPTTENLEATLKAWLIGVSVVLGALCVILLIAFVLKTRALNQRINKLSNTKFGSQESGLNRTGVAAPTTNKHAVEGSNPVYNNDMDAKEIERKMSVTSGDSDLIGVEDDEKFDYNANKEDYN